MKKNHLKWILSDFKTATAFLTSLSLVSPTYTYAQTSGRPRPLVNSKIPSGPSTNPNIGQPTSSSSPSETANNTLSKNQREKFARAGVEEITPENFPETIESFDFPNAEISDVIKAISELTGKNFIIDPQVKGKITIMAPSKITVAEAYQAFLSALAVHGYAIVPSGSFYKVKSARYAQKDSIETFSGAYYPNGDQFITRIIHLKHISADQIVKDLKNLSTKDGDAVVYSATNSLILTDYGSNIDRVMKILNQLDVPGFEEQLEVIQIKYAKAKDLADLVDRIVNKGEKAGGSNAGGFGSAVPRFNRTSPQSGASGQQGGAYFMAIPDDRTNSIIAVGNKSGIERIKKLVAQLDFRIKPEDSGGIYVYQVKFGDAEKLAQVLQGVTKDAGKPTSGASPGGFIGGPVGAAQSAQVEGLFSGDVKINADKYTNSIVSVASKQDYDMVLSLLRKLDTPRDQVFVETYIMEMTVNDGNNWNIGYYKFGEGGVGKTGFNGLGSGSNSLTELLSPTGGSGAILGFGQGKTVDITDPTTKSKVSIPNLVGFISFLKKNNRANILSTPHIMAMDNQEAQIKVGDKVPTRLTTTTSTSGQTSVSADLEEATIDLKIKPFISPATDSVRMEIKQSVKQPTKVLLPKALDDNTQPLATREISTMIVVNSGDTAMLGGLMKDVDKESVSKVPLLGDLPIIGWLFKSREVSTEKVNMLVFMTPKIIRSNLDTQTVISKKLDQRLNFIKAQGGKDPFGAAIDEIQKKQTSAAPGMSIEPGEPQELKE